MRQKDAIFQRLGGTVARRPPEDDWDLPEQKTSGKAPLPGADPAGAAFAGDGEQARAEGTAARRRSRGRALTSFRRTRSRFLGSLRTATGKVARAGLGDVGEEKAKMALTYC